MSRLIDISVPLRAGIASDPPDFRPQINYIDHRQSAQQMADYMGIKPSDLPEGRYAGIEQIMLSSHNGTHVDAPWHYWPTSNHALVPGGEPAARIDQLPLEWFFQPAVKLDFRHLDDGYVVRARDIEAELIRIGHTLKPLDIVVINTAAGTRYGEDDYIDRGCGVGREGTLWLLERGVRVVGTDGWSWDAPFSHTKRRVQETGDLNSHLGRSPRGARYRLFADREAPQSRGAAADRLPHLMLPSQDPSCFSMMDTRAVAIME